MLGSTLPSLAAEIRGLGKHLGPHCVLASLSTHAVVTVPATGRGRLQKSGSDAGRRSGSGCRKGRYSSAMTRGRTQLGEVVLYSVKYSKHGDRCLVETKTPTAMTATSADDDGTRQLVTEVRRNCQASSLDAGRTALNAFDIRSRTTLCSPPATLTTVVIRNI